MSETSKLPTVASFWGGDQLRWLDRLCLKSYVDAGQRVKLYAYQEVNGLPEGVELSDAAEIMPRPDQSTGLSLAQQVRLSDMWRWHLLAKTDEIWIDTDAYCVTPLPDQPMIVGMQGLTANVGVMRLPQDSPVLLDMLEFMKSDPPRLPDDWLDAFPKKKYRYLNAIRRQRRGVLTPLDKMPYAIYGPHGLSHFMAKHGKIEEALPRHALYPYAPERIARNLERPNAVRLQVPADCLSVHLFSSAVYLKLFKMGKYVPRPKTLVARLARKHNIEMDTDWLARYEGPAHSF